MTNECRASSAAHAQDPVTHDFGDCSPEAIDDSGDAVHQFVEQVGHRLIANCPDNFRRLDQVDEEHRHLPLLTNDVGTICQEAIAEVLRQLAVHPLSSRRVPSRATRHLHGRHTASRTSPSRR
jgi:hypothetical protein